MPFGNLTLPSPYPSMKAHQMTDSEPKPEHLRIEAMRELQKSLDNDDWICRVTPEGVHVYTPVKWAPTSTSSINTRLLPNPPSPA